MTTDDRARAGNAARNAERDRQVDELFQQALDVPSDEREAWLAARTESQEMAEEVRQLLAAADDTTFLQPAGPGRAIDIVTQVAASLRVGDRLGRYRIIGEIGRGGMGVVYEARRDDGVYDQRVAIKILARTHSDTALARFRRERQILAHLQHPGVARLLDGGVTQHGQPFLVMERIEGLPVDDYCRQQRSTLRERLDLFLQACRAVESAHQLLIVHRDLKPSNILVTGDGVVKLLDFGIAKWISEEEADGKLTATAGRVLTPAYASPEQFRGGPVTVATDIYQLGLLLYLLLCGELPFDRSEISLEEILEQLDSQIPTAPSQRLRDLQVRSGALPATQDVRGDLDAIALRCLRSEPGNRYRSVSALIEDLEAYFAGHPVQARAPTLRYRLGKFTRRHRSLVTAVTSAVLVGIVLTAGFVWRLTRERDAAEDARVEAEEVTRLMLRVFRSANPMQWNTPAEAAGEFLEQGLAVIEPDLAERPLLRARVDHAVGVALAGVGESDRARESLERSLNARERLLGSDHPEVGRTLTWLSQVIDEPTERAALARRAVRTLEANLGPAHPDVAQAELALGTVLARDPETVEEARLALERALSLYEQATPPEPTAVVQVLSVLGRAHILAGALDDAERALGRAQELAQDELPQHALHASILSNLGWLARSRNQWEVGEAHYQQALSILTAIYGEESPELSGLWMRRGALAHRAGNLAEAEYAIRRALHLESLRQTPREDQLISYREGLASVLTDVDRPAEATIVLREVVAASQRLRGATDPLTAWSHYELARSELASGELGAARANLQRAEEIFRVALGEQHRWRSWPLQRLGEIALREGNPRRARTLLREALALRRASLDPNREEIAESEEALGEAERRLRASGSS